MLKLANMSIKDKNEEFFCFYISLMATMNQKQQLIFKILVIGESKTGKTGLVTRYVDSYFSETHHNQIRVTITISKLYTFFIYCNFLDLERLLSKID